MKKQTGFTLLELIIVVALIVILVLVMIVAIEKYVDKGKDTAIKTNLFSVLMTGSSWRLIHGDYSDFCDEDKNSVLKRAKKAIADIGPTASCSVKSDKTEWCACSALDSDETSSFCVDSTERQIISNSTCDNVCPSYGYCEKY